MRRNIKGKKLTGFTRPVTRVRFNADGDLLFGASVDKNIFSWRGDRAESLGVFNGHTGAVQDIALTQDSTKLLSAAADCSVQLWDVETSSKLATIENERPSSHVQISLMHDKFFHINTMNEKFLLTIRSFQDNYPVIAEFTHTGVPTCAIWGALSDQILIGLESGQLVVYSLKDKNAKALKAHTGELRDIQMSLDYLNIITCSTDSTVILWDSETFEQVLFDIGARMNSISISPFKNYFVCGGGTKSSDFTTTKNSGVDIIFYDIKRKTSCGKIISPHSGPVNTLRIRNDGMAIASGAEDSTINFYPFDDSSILSL